jgi:exopolysaccharide biosynthesis polyprenyl glycosylphosphotransferase
MAVLVAPPPGKQAAGMTLRLAVLETIAVFEMLRAAPLVPSLARMLLATLVVVLVLEAAVRGWRARQRRVERVLIMGSGALARQLVEAIEARPDRGQRVVRIVDDAALRELGEIVEHARPDRVIVALASRRGRMPLKTLLDLRVRGIVVEDGADYFEQLTGKVPIEAVTPASFIFGGDSRSRRTDRAMPWSLSRPFAVVGLVVLAPLLALIALAIKLDSPGPVFFIQPRVGRGGRPFKLIKFRTMRPTTGRTSEWVRDNHSRLTRVGRWLRRFRLDELPQLVNVVIGDMNIVGPRPHPVSNLSLLALVARNTPECGEQIPFYALRSLVRPGLTGWAQVRYRYANDLEEEIEKMRYDLYYIKHRSFWLDLRILLETVTIVIRGRESVDPAGEPAGAARSSQAALKRAEAIERPVAPSLPIPSVAPVSMGAMSISRPHGRGTVRA